MRKYFFLLIAATMTLTAATAQEKMQPMASFSIGLEGANPAGDINDSHSFGLGASALGELMVAKSLGITLSAGYLHYFGKKYSTPIGEAKFSSVGQVPLLAGFRYYFIKDIYLSGQLGASFFNRNIGTGFTYVPGIGLKVSVLDLNLKYMGVIKDGLAPSNISLRVAYTL